MADRLHVATRKGLFELARGRGMWEVGDVQFLGDPVGPRDEIYVFQALSGG